MRTSGGLGLGFLSVIAALLSLQAAAQTPFVAPELSYTYPDRDAFSGDDIAIGVGVGIEWPHGFDLGLNYRVNRFLSADESIQYDQQALELFSRWRLGDGKGIDPGFLLAGGAARTETADDWIIRPYFAGGLTLSAPIYGNEFSLIGELRGHYYYDAEKLTNDSVGIEPVATLQLKYVPDPHPAKTPPSTQKVAPPVAALSQSVSGQCAALTPEARQYDSLQCSALLDRDRDGVADQSDHCPFTISGVPVDADGCMIGS